jgi:uncharacterized membrane protein YeaQ/YmgE (transglycosylase-associated protein family)
LSGSDTVSGPSFAIAMVGSCVLFVIGSMVVFGEMLLRLGASALTEAVSPQVSLLTKFNLLAAPAIGIAASLLGPRSAKIGWVGVVALGAGAIVAAAGQQMSGFYIAGFVVSGLVLGFALLNLKKGTV